MLIYRHNLSYFFVNSSQSKKDFGWGYLFLIVLAAFLLGWVWMKTGSLMVPAVSFSALILSVIPNPRHKYWLLFLLSLAIFSLFTFWDFIGSDGLYPVCRKQMGFLLENEKKSTDEDGDGFSSHCEEKGHSSDTDATEISDFSEALPPSFAEQFNKEDCVFRKGMSEFVFYHAGLPGQTIKSYRLNIVGANFNCPVLPEDKLENKMRCVIDNEDFKRIFATLNTEFSLWVHAIPEDQSKVEEFRFNSCIKK